VLAEVLALLVTAVTCFLVRWDWDNRKFALGWWL